MALGVLAIGTAGFVVAVVWNIVKLWGRVEQVAQRVDDVTALLRTHIKLDQAADKLRRR